MTQTLEDIWKKRIGYMKNKTWNGDDPKCGFDFSNGIHPHLTYSKKNWKDLTIQDLRELLASIPQGLAPEGFTHMPSAHGVLMDTLYRTDAQIPVRIDVTRIEGQTYCVLHLVEIGVFSVSWYKNRGRIDSIIDLEYGTPATLEDVTDMLVALNLEAPYDIPDTDT